MKKEMLILLVLAFITQIYGMSDSQVCDIAKRALKSLNVNAVSVKVADGRAKGGERAIIITFITNRDSNKHIVELGTVLEMGWTASSKADARFDSVVAIAGNRAGNVRAMITVKINDVGTFVRNKNASWYMKQWTVVRTDKTYIPVVAAAMGW